MRNSKRNWERNSKRNSERNSKTKLRRNSKKDLKRNSKMLATLAKLLLLLLSPGATQTFSVKGFFKT